MEVYKKCGSCWELLLWFFLRGMWKGFELDVVPGTGGGDKLPQEYGILFERLLEEDVVVD